MIHVLAILATLTASEAQGAPESVSGSACEIADAVLSARGPHDERPLAEYQCVLDNRRPDGRIPVKVVWGTEEGEGSREVLVGNQGTLCGRKYALYSRRWYPRGKHMEFLFSIRLHEANGVLLYEAGLGGTEFSSEGKWTGATIGIGCGAGDQGVLVHEGRRWSIKRAGDSNR